MASRIAQSMLSLSYLALLRDAPTRHQKIFDKTGLRWGGRNITSDDMTQSMHRCELCLKLQRFSVVSFRISEYFI